MSNSTVVVVSETGGEKATAQEGVPHQKTSNTFSWHDVSFSVPIGKKDKKVLLQNMSGSVKSGEIVAVLGSSGAGKSTLLNILAGRLGPGELTGRILLNGQPRNPRTWTKDCSFVEQDDLMYPFLTVEETIGYSAKLRLSCSLSPAGKQGKVEDAIMDLGLNSARKTIIGSADVKGISGGERKRVAIGVELITEPSILFMDEPTSGLDAFTAFNIVDSIKKLAARRGMIVIMTIHQPRTDILELFDKVLILSVGRTLWFGESNDALHHFEKLGYTLPPKTNPSDFFLDITTLDQRSDELQQKSMLRIKKFISAWEEKEIEYNIEQDVVKDSLNDHKKSKWTSPYATSWFNEFQVLLIRNLKDTARGLIQIIVRLLESTAVMLILGFIFFKSGDDYQGVQNKIGVLFFVCINLTFSMAMPQVVSFALQRLMVRRERTSGMYRPSSAYFAKWVSTLPIVFAAGSILIFPLYWMIGLHNSSTRYRMFITILFVHANAANALGLLIGSALKDVNLAQVIGPLVITVFLLFGGPLVSLTATPVLFRWIQYVSIISYSNKALSQNEFSGTTLDCANATSLCYKTGDELLQAMTLNELSIYTNIGCNLLLTFGFLLVGFFFFSHTSKPNLRLQ